MTFTAEQIRKGHSPESRRKAVETMRKNKTGIFKPRKKAAKAKKGRTSLIDVSTLPLKPKRRMGVARKQERVMRTPLVKAQLVQKVTSLIATGMTIKDAATKVGIFDAQYRGWKKDRDVKKAMNGYAHHPAPAGDAVRLILKLNGEDHNVSLQEAQSLREGLDALLGPRP